MSRFLNKEIKNMSSCRRIFLSNQALMK